jgi:hypothetical protein
MKKLGRRYGGDGWWGYIVDTNYVLICKLHRSILDSTEEARSQVCDVRYAKDCATQPLLDVCGFNAFPPSIDCLKSPFQLFGQEINSIPSHWVIGTPDDDLVVIFGDKWLMHDQIVKRQGYLGEIMFKLLQLLSINYNKNPRVIRDVFAVRMITHHVTCFRIKPIKATLDTLINTREDPKTKLTLICSDPDPINNKGLSLIDPTERKQAVKLLTSIRHVVLQ